MNTPPKTPAGWLSHPVVSLLIAATWLLLQQSLAVPQLIAATVLALLLPRLLHGFLGTAIRLRAPGTVSCVVDEARGEILVHALDCADAAGMAAQIKQRYEAPLMEIFG